MAASKLKYLELMFTGLHKDIHDDADSELYGPIVGGSLYTV